MKEAMILVLRPLVAEQAQNGPPESGSQDISLKSSLQRQGVFL